MRGLRFSKCAVSGSMTGAGLGQDIGWWRPDKSTGKVAIPEGPQAPIARPDQDLLPDGSGRLRDPRTAENMAIKAEALAPRRWRPQ